MNLCEFSVIVLTAILVSSAQAQECNTLNVVDVDIAEDDIAGASHGFRSEPSGNSPRNDVYYAIDRSESGYGAISAAVLFLTNGSKAKLEFDFTMHAVTSNVLDAQDHYFEKALNATEIESYHAIKESYDGSLSVPMLSWIGINLGENVTRQDMDMSAQHTRNYNELAQRAQTVMNTTTAQTVRITGSLEVQGISATPTAVYAYIKVAQVKLINGRTMTVVTAGENELAAGTKDGIPVPSDNGEVTVVQLQDYVAP